MAAGAAALIQAPDALAAERVSVVARPPQGFVPLSLPGHVVRVTKRDTLQPNGLWPTPEAAEAMLERAMTELTGKASVAEAFAQFVHKDDKVAIKLNGIAGQKGATMATNKELVLPIVRAIVAAGVPASSIVVFEQYPSFLAGTRVASRNREMDKDFPEGVRATVHENKDATMDYITVAGISTKFVRPFTEATAVINVSMIKDHGICGFTGAMKNITHGCTVNPQAFHAHNACPQIAQLYAQDVVKSRVRLHIADAFKVIYDQGPLDKNVRRRVPHEAVYAGTDPVALDVIGWEVIEQLRKDNGLPTLRDARREPTYIQTAAELGLGIADRSRITLRDVAI